MGMGGLGPSPPVPLKAGPESKVNRFLARLVVGRFFSDNL